ncbi:MAG: hypothetical protein HQM10_19630 [Candidatus Riflebacteria bacterium]|nr:hypothetical protein [Candidatus Riflebacteria bacterium]
MNKLFIRTNLLAVLLLTIILFIINVNLLSAESSTMGKAHLKEILSWNTGSETESINLKSMDKTWNFFPQSFILKDGFIWIINRHDPLLVKYPMQEPFVPQIIPLSHSKDKKFSARFFIDLVIDQNDIYCLEQSTASFRKTDETGVINTMFLITENDGVVIAKAWKNADNEFAFFDEGSHKVYFRKFGPKTNDTPDMAGHEIDVEEPSILPAKDGILAIAKPEENLTAVSFYPRIETGNSIKAAVYDDAKVLPLDSDDQGNFYLHVSVKDQDFISVLKKDGDMFSEKRYSVDKIAFPENITQYARISGANKLILIVSEANKLCLKECTLAD